MGVVMAAGGDWFDRLGLETTERLSVVVAERKAGWVVGGARILFFFCFCMWRRRYST